MEYGIRAMETEGQVVARPFSETEVFEPCARLDPYVRPSCAYWQPMWWTASHPERDNGREMAQLMKEWCDEFPGGETTRLACLAGSVNRIQLLTDEDPSRVGTICGILAADDTSRYLCHVFSAVRFAHYYPLEYAEKACAHLPLEAEISCRERSTDLTLARRTDLQLYNELLSTALSWGKAD